MSYNIKKELNSLERDRILSEQITETTKDLIIDEIREATIDEICAPIEFNIQQLNEELALEKEELENEPLIKKLGKIINNPK